MDNGNQQNTFDLQVTHRDEKTGKVFKTNPYTLRVLGSPEGGRTRLWERPVGSGNLFDKKNNPVGRWVVDKDNKQGKYVKDAKHIEFKIPETEDQKLAKTMIEQTSKIAELEKELANIRSEKTKKE
jgi:hypothetical protein